LNQLVSANFSLRIILGFTKNSFMGFSDENGGGGMTSGNPGFLVGTGIYDITGPAAERGMMGYARVSQRTKGIHMRLRSRAFVVASPANGKRIVYVCADLGMITQGVKQRVVELLKQTYGGLYDEKNVLLSANHTHSGPGGYSHYTLYNLTILGYDEKNFDCIADGIYESIVRAHKTNNENLVPVDIFINTGDVLKDGCLYAGWNRSPEAYDRNPEWERKQYPYNANPTMTLLKFITPEGKEIGMINWFATHPTSISNSNKLITGDHKGLASYVFETGYKNNDYNSYMDSGSPADIFVAIFAQAEAGDVSPNIPWGYPDGVSDYEHMEIIAARQLEKAIDLYKSAAIKLTGNIDYRHKFVDFSKVCIDPNHRKWGDGQRKLHTCKAAIGFSKIAGSTEDGIGLPFVPEGMTYDGVKLPKITLIPELQQYHKEKRILLPTGDMMPLSATSWTPQILPVQILRIGNLALLAFPFECSTMSGRRLKKTVEDDLATAGINQIVVSSLSNAYAGYMTTREEYSAQHYEGASTHFGPFSLMACQQISKELAEGMANGTPVPPGELPLNLSNKQKKKVKTKVFWDAKPLCKNFGKVHKEPKPSYKKCQTVSVVFWGGNPRNDFLTQDSFLVIEKKSNGAWKPISHDWDPETWFKWKKFFLFWSKITIEWDIHLKTSPGEYRIRHNGFRKKLFSSTPISYSGESRPFRVE
jgi:neutral ceramidase